MTSEAIYGVSAFCPKCGQGATYEQPIKIATNPIRYEIDVDRALGDVRGSWTVKCSVCDWVGIGQRAIERPRVMGLF
jgi:hypothetical protein